GFRSPPQDPFSLTLRHLNRRQNASVVESINRGRAYAKHFFYLLRCEESLHFRFSFVMRSQCSIRMKRNSGHSTKWLITERIRPFRRVTESSGTAVLGAVLAIS